MHFVCFRTSGSFSSSLVSSSSGSSLSLLHAARQGGRKRSLAPS